jgi:hypothetical protein
MSDATSTFILNFNPLKPNKYYEIVTIIIRTILGLLFLYTSIGLFLHLSPEHQQASSAFQVGLSCNLFIPLAKVLDFYVATHL